MLQGKIKRDEDGRRRINMDIELKKGRGKGHSHEHSRGCIRGGGRKHTGWVRIERESTDSVSVCVCVCVWESEDTSDRK